ncbi:MAG TPA: hypothetical protein VMW27_12155 [Thermoanaerobaculia bacterium]|nr:hypothetical protein [Thermoanaerobaculia bacterium]
MPTYSGLLVRDNYSDTGATPTAGNLWLSPDIIPYQDEVLTWAQASGTYASGSLALPFQNNSTNNIYLRAKNVSNSAMTATVSLYYTQPSLFLYPSEWNQITAPATTLNLVTGSGSASIPAGALAWTQQPFVLQAFPSGGHYCMIAVVNNNGEPVTVPSSFTGNAGFASFIQNNPNVAYRNVNRTTVSGAIAGTIQLFGNDNDYESGFVFSITGYQVPSAATVWYDAQCVDSRLPDGSFNATGVFNSQDLASFQINVPANVGTGPGSTPMAMSITYSSNMTLPTGTTFVVNNFGVPEGMDPLEPEVTRLYTIAGRTPETADTTETVPLIWVGSTTWIFD